MKRAILFSLLAFGVSHLQVNAQWVESGNSKNTVWEYNFSGAKGTQKGKGIEKISTPSSQNFLPKPVSGEVRISTSDESTKDGSAFILNDKCNTCLTMVHSSGNGLKPAPSKFIARNFANSSKVMSTHFKLKLNHEDKNKQAIWYVAVGDGSNTLFTNKNMVPLISTNGPTDHTIYTLFRFRKAAFEGKYNLQARYSDGSAKWAWQTISGVALNKDTDYQIDVFFNNSEEPQSYVHNGATKTLAAASYHIYVDNVQKGTNLTTLKRNVTQRGENINQYTGNLSGFTFLSREAAQSFTGGTASTDPVEDDNSALAIISDLKIIHKPIK